MKRIIRITALILTLAMTVLIMPQTKAYAYSKLSNGTYEAYHYGGSKIYIDDYHLPRGYCEWAKIKGNKLIVKGCLGKRAKGSNDIVSQTTYKKRTLKLAKNCKILAFSSEDEKYLSYPKSNFNQEFNSCLPTISFEFVVKNNKVTKIVVYS